MNLQVYITDHAWRRWRERVGPGKRKDIRRRVKRRLATQLRMGLEACDREAFELEIFPGVLAVMMIDRAGFWVVKTFRHSTEIEEAKP